ncbi:hypothetical protein IFR05_012444 [Cadophora sp. M221]|nr:hypothetical protein IFR05_012444 [Cadophora sp. M221]
MAVRELAALFAPLLPPPALVLVVLVVLVLPRVAPVVARAALYEQIADSLREEADQEEEDSSEEEGSVEL